MTLDVRVVPDPGARQGVSAASRLVSAALPSRTDAGLRLAGHGQALA